MPDNIRKHVSIGTGNMVSTALLTVFAHVVIVLVAAGTGVSVQYLFPQTFSDLLSLCGLGKFALWQISAGVAYASVLFKPLVSIFHK